MKYDILNAYRAYLKTNLSATTVQTYYNRIEQLLYNQFDLNNIDIEKILNNLARMNYKNEFSQSKNALLYFCEFRDIALNDEQLKTIEILSKKTHKKYKKNHVINYKRINSTINHLHNKRLRLAYQLMLASGLRVFEVAQITKDDIDIYSDKLEIEFTGKGGVKRQVTLHKDNNVKLYTELIELTRLQKKDNLFYSLNYLQKQAKRLSFCCHDLRRIYAIKEYRKHHNKQQVRKLLHHKNLKTTNIYLRSKLIE